MQERPREAAARRGRTLPPTLGTLPRPVNHASPRIGTEVTLATRVPSRSVPPYRSALSILPTLTTLPTLRSRRRNIGAERRSRVGGGGDSSAPIGLRCRANDLRRYSTSSYDTIRAKPMGFPPH